MSLVALEPMLVGGCKADETRLEIGRGVINPTLVEGPWKGPPQKVRVL
jgi:hypothetical protein